MSIGQPGIRPEPRDDIGTWLAGAAPLNRNGMPPLSEGRRYDMIVSPSGHHLSVLHRQPGALDAYKAARDALSRQMGNPYLVAAHALRDANGTTTPQPGEMDIIPNALTMMIRAKMLEDHGIDTFASTHGATGRLHGPAHWDAVQRANEIDPATQLPAGIDQTRMADRDNIYHALEVRDAFRRRSGYARGGALRRAAR
jgi:hypothetical protein